MTIIPKWYRRARRFILEQRQVELEKAIARYPNSERYAQRRNELAEIEAELNDLSEK